MPFTTATQAQKKTAADMIDKMMNPSRAPRSNMWTQGWDVVASYSEQKINNLLAERHKTAQGKMLRDLVLHSTWEDESAETPKVYPVTTSLTFGPPVLQFDEAASKPYCSLTMEILSATRQLEGKEPRSMAPGFSLTLGGIPLGSVQGQLVDGQVSGGNAGKPEITPGHIPINFDFGPDDQRHVVLNFSDIKEMTVQINHADPSEAAKSPLNEEKVQKQLKAFFHDDKKATSLSYSIASINNKVKEGMRSLEPVRFQFATCAGPKDTVNSRVLSIMIDVKNGGQRGVSDQLQVIWQSQWAENGLCPIPDGFTASLIISCNTLYSALLKPGFESNNASLTDSTPEGGNGLKYLANVSGSISGGSSEHGTVSLSSWYLNFKDFTIDLRLRQSSGASSPQAEALWALDTNVSWSDDLGFVHGGDGVLKFRWKLASQNDQPRQVPLAINMTDQDFSLQVSLHDPTQNLWQTSREEVSSGMLNLPGGYDWADDLLRDSIGDIHPTIALPNFGLNFFCTTNLLSPGQEVIDFNEDIGVKIPRDVVLVGDVLRQ